MNRQEMIEGLNSVSDKYISYELKIRGHSLRGSTLTSRKKKLHGIFDNEQMNGESQMVFHMQLAEDLNECASFLEEIEFLMGVNLEANAISAEYQLLYLKERVERLPPSPLATMATQRLSILSKIDELEKVFGNVTVAVDSDGNRSTSYVANVLHTEISKLNLNNLSMSQKPCHSSTIRNQTNVNSNIQTSTVQRGNISQNPPMVTFEQVDLTRSPEIANTSHLAAQTTPNSPTYATQFLPQSNLRNSGLNATYLMPNTSFTQSHFNPAAQMWKWNIKFSGDDDKMTANDFIQQLKEHSISRGVSETQILGGMSELLIGSAAKWYRAAVRVKPFNNFSEFAKCFIDDFDPLYKVDTRLEILKKRLQKFGERIVPYFAHMENEFALLTKVQPVPEQIRIIRKNLLPYYISHLACYDFDSIEELKQACKNIEVGEDMIKNQNILRGNVGIPNTPGMNQSVPVAGQGPINTISQPNSYRNNNYQNRNTFQPQTQFANPPFISNLPQNNFNNNKSGSNQNLNNNANIQNNPNQPSQYQQYRNQMQNRGAHFPQNNNGQFQQFSQANAAPNSSINSPRPQQPIQNQNAGNPNNSGYFPNSNRVEVIPNQNLNVNSPAKSGNPHRNFQNNPRQSSGFNRFTGNLDNGNVQNQSFALSSGNPQLNSLNNPVVACLSNQLMMPFVPNTTLGDNQSVELNQINPDINVNVSDLFEDEEAGVGNPEAEN